MLREKSPVFIFPHPQGPDRLNSQSMLSGAERYEDRPPHVETHQWDPTAGRLLLLRQQNICISYLRPTLRLCCVPRLTLLFVVESIQTLGQCSEASCL